MGRVARNPTIDARRAAAAPNLRDPVELAGWAARLEGETAPTIVSWTLATFGEGLVVSSSFQDCVLIDLVARNAPTVEVVFLDTGFHFPETLAYVERVRRRYGLRLSVLRPELDDDQWPCRTDHCCRMRKVEPLRRFVANKTAWMSGVRRVETAERADTPVVEWDARSDTVKINPLVRWTDADVARYERERALPVHPLRTRGYGSIGCAPTTRPVAPHEHPRAGRWPDSDRTECGLHV